MTDELPADLPPSETAIYQALREADRPLTTRQVAERTGIKRRTARDAIDRLRDRDLVETRAPLPTDPQSPVHHLADVEVDVDGTQSGTPSPWSGG